MNIYLETHSCFSFNIPGLLIPMIMSTTGDCECREARFYSLTRLACNFTVDKLTAYSFLQLLFPHSSSAFPMLNTITQPGDSHDDCQAGLMCYQRSGGDPVPGCVGSDSSSTDYCTLPALNDIGNGLSAGSYELCQVWKEHLTCLAFIYLVLR